MKSTKLALAAILLFGTLSACKPEPAAPAAEAAPPAAEPAAVTPAPEPVVAEPATTTAPMTEAPADATDAPAATEEDDDTPHSGGDKVGTKPQGT
ncbi:MAG: hypothetical protein ACREO7_04250 [Pseudoxanthomonas sp.]